MDGLEISLCNLPWWAVLASWLLPALLGYLWAMVQWGRYKAKSKALEKDLSSASRRVVNLENEINECRKAYEKVSKEKDHIVQITKKLPGIELPDISIGTKSTADSFQHAEILYDTKPFFGFAIKKNDLKIIEGITPKIEKLMHDMGILKWSDLESMDISYLIKIVREAGLDQVNPQHWPYEASLAVQGRWADLLNFQNHAQK